MATDPVNCTESSCHGSGGSDMDDWENAEPIVVPQHVRQGHSIATSGTSGTTSWGDDTTAGNAESATHREGFPIIINSGSTRTEYVPQIKFLKRQPEQTKTGSASTSSQSASNATVSMTMAEREAMYEAAKARISAEMDKEYKG
ncbi:hypothetical protein BASA50_006299 [Batrachochytrium salamandrivorans]|uniref:SUZ domain-containing protein n=1 Tax=Batrachochytrium salamandrivorans TaxID=1357716 RepID=A0ABQ8FAB3_9FUNG|nr:hypothetical protein BASA50_006299 [Batrachochytrium salamandrivorans]KAH9276771.1 hypothetical protein BASA83_000906 [Batrachochytrium salamandrivorans]